MNGLGLGINRFAIFNRFVNNLVKSFKSRVNADSGIFEAESCLKTTLNNLNRL